MSEQFDGIFSELSKAGYFKTIKDINQSLSTKVPNSEKGSPYGVAPLDQNRLIPTIHLPSYVDDVLEYSSQNAFPTPGESSKIYVALDNNKIFRWSGSTYIEISPSPGSTDSIPEGTVHLYFTDSRAQAAVTTISGNAGTATKLQNARNITLSGDVNGSVAFDGSSSVSMVTTVGDDSHRHSRSTIDGLGTVATYNVPVSGNASSGQVVLGNDSRLSDSRPASDVSDWAKALDKPPYTAAEVGAQPLDSDLTSISSIIGNGVLGRDSLGAWSFSDGVETAFSSVPRIYLGSSLSTGIDCNDLGYGVAVVRIGSNSSYNTNKPQFKVTQASYAYIQTIRGFDAQSGNGKIQIAWPLNSLVTTSLPVTGVVAFRSVASNSITLPDWEFIVCNMATTSDYGYMTTSQVAALNAAVSSISALQTSKENAFTTLPVSKGGTGVSTLSGIAKFNGTSSIQPATSADIVALVPDATASQAGKMTTTQVSSLNELGGLVSMGSGIVKKTLSTTGLDTYTSAVINDLVTSTTLVTDLNADMLDGNHASAFSPSGHGHSVATTLADGFMSSTQVTSLNTAVSDISTLQTSKENAFTTLPVSKGGTGVGTMIGIAKFNGTSSIQPATSADIVALVPDATASQAGKMTTAQVSSLNELGGLVSMGSGVVKKTLSTTGLDTYTSAVINDLVTSTNVVSSLNADMLDGNHASAFALSGHGHSVATTLVDGFMSSTQVTSLNTAVSDISTLKTSKEDAFTTLPVSKGGTGVGTMIGIAKFNGTSAMQPATSADIVALVPDATTSQSGKMTTAQVSSLNELGGLVSMGSGIVKKTLSTAGLDTYSTAVINDLVTSTILVPNLNADMLDGNHASAFALSGHSHGTLDSITGTGVGLLVKTSTSGNGTYTSAQIASRTTTGLTVSGLTTNGLINISLDSGLDNLAGFSDNSANVGLVKLSAVNSFAKVTSNDIIALVPDATASQAGKMTTAQVSSLNELGGLVSMGSGIVKKTLSTAGLDTYSTAAISDLVTSTNVVSSLNADMLDGLHVGSAASLSITHIPYVGGDGVIELGKYIDFHLAPGNDYDLRLTSALNANGTANIANLYLKGGSMTSDALIWHNANDGDGSGLDADLLDGIQATGFLRSNLSTTYSGNTLTMATNLKYTPSSTLTTQGIITYGVEDVPGYCRLRTYGRDSSNTITGARFGWSTGTRYINIDTKPDPILPAYDCINIFPTTTSAQVALRIDNNLVWHEGNDGPGSGLNADLVDNIHGSVLVRNDITNQELKGFSLGAPAGTSLSNGIVFNRGLDNDSGWSLKSSGTTASPIFTLVDTFTDSLLRPRYEWSNAAYYPTTTNTISLGSSASKWTVVYATTGTINTSDARMKTSVEPFTQNELKASKLLADEIGLYKFLDSITSKGDQARRHVGMTVQRAIEIMTQCGLEPFDYGFICYDEWVEDSGETKSQYAFRYDQLNMFIIRGLSERVSALESR